MKITPSFAVRLSLFLAVSLAAHALAAEKQLKTVGLTVGDLGNPFFVQIAHGTTAQARTYNPNVNVISLSSNYDVKNQASQIKDFISSGVDMIILGAANSKAVGCDLAAQKAGQTSLLIV